MNSINNLDENMTKGMLKAEQQIKLRSNLHPWPQHLQMLYWNFIYEN